MMTGAYHIYSECQVQQEFYKRNEQAVPCSQKPLRLCRSCSLKCRNGDLMLKARL